MDERGVTPVLGVVLLVGIAAMGALLIFVASGTIVEGLQSDAELEQAEQSMTELASSSDRIASAEADVAEYAIRGSDEATTTVDGDTGSYELRVQANDDVDILTSGDLGAVTYRDAEGRRLAFQGGGVWRQDPAGEAQMVAAPDVHYRPGDDPTLTLPMVTVGGDDAGSVAGYGTLRAAERRDIYPSGPNHTNPLRSGTVELAVESEYCQGWQEFFDSRTDEAITERCSQHRDTVVGELEVTFHVPTQTEPYSYDDELVVVRDFDEKEHRLQPREYVEREHDHPSPSATIEQAVQSCAAGNGEPLAKQNDGPGLYCASEMDDDTNYKFDPDGGEIKVAVDGDVDAGGIQIQDDGNVTIMATGDYAMNLSGGTIWGSSSTADQLRLLVHSDSQFSENDATPQGLTVWGFIYGPDAEIHMPNNLNIHGGLVADRFVVHDEDPAGSYNPVSDVGDIELEFSRGGDPFYYLHVSETDLEVDR